mmetsp:Transcript_3708/g.6509  ORF Transcript_3708/g.6509 Transcript_3708/m.6509 type:complete len:254 (+) Transcript_3708:1425-2186(+)
MLLQIVAQGVHVHIVEILKCDEFHVGARFKYIFFVVDVCDTATHTCTKVLSGLSQDSDATAGHVLKTVVTYTFNYDDGTRVTDTESLTSDTTYETATSSGSVKAHVSSNHVVFCNTLECGLGVHSDGTTTETLSKVIVGVTTYLDRNTRRKECTTTLASATVQLDVYGVCGESRGTVALGYFERQHSTHGTVDVEHIFLDCNRAHLLQGVAGESDQLHVERVLETVVLALSVDHMNGLLGENKREGRCTGDLC